MRVIPGSAVQTVQDRIDAAFPQLTTVRTIEQFGRADRSLSLILGDRLSRFQCGTW